MSRQLIIGLIAEGSTDYKYLTSLVRRTFENLAFQCTGDVEITNVQVVKVTKTDVNTYVLEGARKSYQDFGISVLCVHQDADSRTSHAVYENLVAAIEAVVVSEEELCKNIVPLVPITEIESWMLADKALFIDEIGSTDTEQNLGIAGNPEKISDPKEKINNAIRIEAAKRKGRRSKLKIGELYQPLGEKAEMDRLMELSSFQRFYEDAKSSLIKIGYIRP